MGDPKGFMTHGRELPTRRPVPVQATRPTPPPAPNVPAAPNVQAAAASVTAIAIPDTFSVTSLDSHNCVAAAADMTAERRSSDAGFGGVGSGAMTTRSEPKASAISVWLNCADGARVSVESCNRPSAKQDRKTVVVENAGSFVWPPS